MLFSGISGMFNRTAKAEKEVFDLMSKTPKVVLNLRKVCNKKGEITKVKCISDCEGDFRFLTVSKEYETIPMNFDSRDEVIDWMINNQLGRRNLSKETMSYLRGLQYTREKKKSEDNLKQNSTRTPTGQNVHSITTAEKLAEQHKGNQHTELEKAQTELLPTTAEKLATQHNVSRETIKRDAE